MNGASNIQVMHGMFYVVFAMFLLVVIEVALITNYMVLSSE